MIDASKIRRRAVKSPAPIRNKKVAIQNKKFRAVDPNDVNPRLPQCRHSELDAGELDHLGPLVGLVDDHFADRGGGRAAA
jgi:hypothetical protein